MAYDSYTKGSYGTYTTGTLGTPTMPPPERIYTWNIDEYQCDFQSWNKAVDAGLDPRVTGPDVDFNNRTVNQIYDTNYKDKATSQLQAGTKGFGFFSSSGAETEDPQHMMYYEYNGGSTVRVWDPSTGPNGSWQDYNVGGTVDAATKWVALPTYR